MFGAIEAGGTKFVYGLISQDGKILERFSCPTEKPETTIPKIVDYFKDKNIKALGLGSFGPIDPNPNSPTYGHITTTPKPYWADVDLIVAFKELGVPIGFDTDVNGAALGEALWGEGQNLQNIVYITVGTGIGAGLIVEGNLVHGALHPEAGHMILRNHPEDTFDGKCPFHGTCWEGLASGPAIEKRWGIKASELEVEHKAWDFQAYYMAQALMNIILVVAPEKIILGGGVMKQKHLFPKIHQEVQKLLAQYIKIPQITKNIQDYIVPPKLGDNAGFLGAGALAKNALKN